MVGADLEGLVTAHDQAGLAVLLVLKQTDVTSASLLPLAGLLDELEKLGAHLEDLLLRLLVGLGLDLLGQLDDGLEVDILGLGSGILYTGLVSQGGIPHEAVAAAAASAISPRAQKLREGW